MEIDLAILGQAATESDIKGEVVLDLIERLVLAESELEAIKKQEAKWYREKSTYELEDKKSYRDLVQGCYTISDNYEPLYSKPVYQHSFTVDGHTFYADSEFDILYLERKFGVGGKAKLEAVRDE